MKNPGELEIKVHCDGDILSQSLRGKCQYDDICEQYPGAVAIETEGKGNVTAENYIKLILRLLGHTMVRHNNREHKGIIQRTSVVRYTDQQPDRNDINVNMMLVVIKTLMK